MKIEKLILLLDKITKYLEIELIGNRYESIDNLQNKIYEIIDRIDLTIYISDLEDTTKDDYIESDYQLVCEIKDFNGNEIGFIDIYYLKMRNNGLYITEINVEEY